MIKPLLQDDAFLADVRSAPAGTGQFHLWWLGQSGFLLQWNGRHLLFDPYLSDSLTKKYARTDKPHVRMTGRVVDPARLDFIDVITSSHNHTDHLDAETLVPLFAANPGAPLVLGRANVEFAAARLQAPPERLRGVNAGEELTHAGFTLNAIPAAHNELDQDPHGNFNYLGFVTTFGPFAIYHSGDTLRYPGMTAWLKEFAIDVALLPINGNLPERRVAGNLDGPEAAQLAKDVRARLVIPCHYDMFEFNTAAPELFVSACRELGQPYRTLRAGERLTISQ